MWFRQRLLCPLFVVLMGTESLQSNVTLKNYGAVLESEPLTSTSDQEQPSGSQGYFYMTLAPSVMKDALPPGLLSPPPSVKKTKTSRGSLHTHTLLSILVKTSASTQSC